MRLLVLNGLIRDNLALSIASRFGSSALILSQQLMLVFISKSLALPTVNIHNSPSNLSQTIKAAIFQLRWPLLNLNILNILFAFAYHLLMHKFKFPP